MGPEDFETLVGTYYEDLYRFAYSLARNPDDAGDLVQQTFVIFAQKGDALREISKAKSWLFTTLYREFLRQTARSKRVVSMEESDLDVRAIPAPAEAPRNAEQNEMLEALASLPDSPRAILALYYLDDCSYKDIADTLNIPIGTVMSRLSRAKMVLRDCLKIRSGGNKAEDESLK